MATITPTERARQAAETLLSAHFDQSLQLTQAEVQPDVSHVFRFALQEASAGLPQSVIVKCARSWGSEAAASTPTEPFPGSQRLFNDWAAIQFLNQLAGDPGIVPQFYTGDPQLGLFVMEDLGTAEFLENLLLAQTSAPAEQLLLDLIEGLGTMHARTIGQQAHFNRLRTALGPGVSLEDYDELAAGFVSALETLGLSLPTEASAQLQQVVVYLKDPGPFLALTHGDACPGNAAYVDGTLRFFDFEASSYRHALLDGVYGRLLLPSCWCSNRLPERVWQQMEAVYRSALSQSCPAAADDDLYKQAIVVACIYWGLALFRYHPRLRFYDLLADDEEWGVSTGRQRIVVRSEIIAQTGQTLGYLQALGATFAEVAAQLRTRWPDVEAMPTYPAFL